MRAAPDIAGLPPALGPVVEDIRRLRRRGEPVLAAIDGRCAAGKTTLAGQLQARFGWPVVHMDHFFPRPEQRTPQRLALPGGNVDHERFLEQVLLPLSRGRFPTYRPFDCRTMSLGLPRAVPPAPVVLVEGAYACHPALAGYYPLRVFLTVDPEEQLRRILARNGPEGLAAFREKWIPLEERYFAAWPPQGRFHHILQL